jgi:hypothetical protein
MNADMLHFVFPLLALYCFVVAFLVYLLIKVPSTYKLKWVGVPLLLVASFFSYDAYVSKLGRAFPTLLPEQEFILIEAKVVGNKEAIEMWIKENKKTSRFIRIPYDEKTMKQIQRALERGKKTGIPQVGKRKKSNGDRQGYDNQDQPDNEFYDFPFERDMPKTETEPPTQLAPPTAPTPDLLPPAPAAPR